MLRKIERAFGVASLLFAILTFVAVGVVAHAQDVINPQTNASALTTGTVAAGRMPALTGDCTTSAGAVATTCTSINNVNQTTAWTTYTPSITCTSGSGQSATAAGRSKTLGKTIFVEITLTITTISTCAFIQTSLPTTAAAAVYVLPAMNTTTGTVGRCQIASGGSLCTFARYDAADFGANSTVLVASGVYESN